MPGSSPTELFIPTFFFFPVFCIAVFYKYIELSPGLPPTHAETTTTSESVWASLLNEREDPRPREETPGREGGC